MSMLTVVREVLHAIHGEEELIPYAPITTRHMIADYQPARPWKRRITALLLNAK